MEMPPTYRLSAQSDRDISGILEYSLATFGERRAQDYYEGLLACFSLICQNPRIGRDYGHIRQGYFRYEHARHSIFYRIEPAGILVVRVLHQGQDPESHL